MNISARLDRELRAGPLDYDLPTLGFTQVLQATLDKIPVLLQGLEALYIAAIALTVLVAIALIGLALPRPINLVFQPVQRFVTAIILLGTVLLFIANVVISTEPLNIAREVNKSGKDIGLSASASPETFDTSLACLRVPAPVAAALAG